MYPIKRKADSTLMGMTKAELIEEIRCLENNWESAEWFNANQAKYCEKLLAQYKWIPVTERLPMGADGKSFCENVIAYLNNGEVKAQVCSGWLNGDKWYLLAGDKVYHTVWGLGAVTHWMPLPEPPKEGE